MVNDKGAASRALWRPLSLHTIEAKAKSVILDRYFTVRIALTPSQERDYIKIRGLVANGGNLSGYYRKSLNADRLLKSHQVMHLHLGGSGSDAILYLVQYPEHVLFVTIDTHRHLRTTPPGNALMRLGRVAFEAKLKAETDAVNARLLAAKAKLFPAPMVAAPNAPHAKTKKAED